MGYKFHIRKPEAATPTEVPQGVRFAVGGERAAIFVSHPSGSDLLSNLRWGGEEGAAAFDHGQPVKMLVDAKGLDGRTVLFILERFEDGEWKRIDSRHADVVNGVASAEAPARHSGEGDSSQLRFRCELV